MEEIKIIEYSPELAAKVADMWNKSREGWGGGSAVTTEEQVRQQEENSGNIKLYLAMANDEVIGYCGLSEYREDEGALYIPLLNVRGDYQGKKIGKLLLLKALEKTIELGWPRLDLYTWAGNTKAVPLYKKCGFFWEDRDDTTHLMNFIPTVLNTEAVKDFFLDVDWYEASKRLIEVKPDGRREKDFDYFEYHWERDGKELRLEFEQRGRGLRLIETDEYLISVELEGAELVFGKEYKVYYRVVNKTNNPLEIDIRGYDDKNIDFSFNKNIAVDNEVIIEGFFKVKEIKEDQSIWRTHPTVAAEVLINGKRATLKIGLVPKFPVKVTAKVANLEGFINAEGEYYIDIENNFNEEILLSLRLPETNLIKMVETSYSIALMAKDRKSLTIPYVLLEHGFYQPTLQLEAKLKSGEVVSFHKEIGVPFKGIGAKFAGECEEYWHIYNGHNQVLLRKFNNTLIPNRANNKNQTPIAMLVPKIGKPFSTEFAKKKPIEVEVYFENNSILQRAVYLSDKFTDIMLVSYTRLFAEGIIEQYFEIVNNSSTETNEEMWLSHPVALDLIGLVIPYDNEIIQTTEDKESSYKDWKCSRLTENWLFTTGNDFPCGIAWSSKSKVNFESWYMNFESFIGRLPAKTSHVTEAIYISTGAYKNWEEFRAFALRRHKPEAKVVGECLQLLVNNNNPILKPYQKECTVDLKSYRNEFFDGRIELGLKGDVPQQVIDFREEESKTMAPFNLKVKERTMDVIQLNSSVFNGETSLHKLLLREETVAFKEEERIEEGDKLYLVDNGVIKLKASSGFFPVITSMVYNNREWLDSSYPAIQPKSWWNPWGGGIGYAMEGINNSSINKAAKRVSFTSLEDQHKNIWRGIRLEVIIDNHPEFKGLQWNQYFLMLPGIPVVASSTEILQNTGRYIQGNRNGWYSSVFLKLADGGWMKTLNENGQFIKYSTGKWAIDIHPSGSILFGNDREEDFIQTTTDQTSSKLGFYYNKEVAEISNMQRLNIKDGERPFTNPVFYIFTNRPIPEDALSDLKKIRFK